MPPEAVSNPIVVFVSSSQDEFSSLRKRLRKAIENEPFADYSLMKGILIEDERGPVIKQKVKTHIDKSAIYLGVFGRVRSKWTIAEFWEARDRGLPLLIYHFKRATRPGRPRQTTGGPRSPAERFLRTHVRALSVTVSTHHSEAGLLKKVLQDLAFQAAELVNENAQIRKTIHKPSIEP